MIIQKYLYISKPKNSYSHKTQARISSNKGSTKKDEICIKLNLEIDPKVFDDIITSVSFEIPNTHKKVVNLRID